MSEALLEKILSEVTGIKQDISEMKSDIAELKADVAELKADVTVLKTDVVSLKSDVGSLQKDMKFVKTELSILKADLDTANFRLERIESEQAEMKQVLLETRNQVRHVDQIEKGRNPSALPLTALKHSQGRKRTLI